MNANPAGTRQKPKLLDHIRSATRAEHYSIRAEEAYVRWIKRFILFHKQLYTLLLCSFLRLMQRARGCLPFALDKKHPNEAKEWGRRYVFPASITSIDPRSGDRCRDHIDEAILQKAVASTVRQAGIAKPGYCRTVRHHATHLLQSGYDNRILQHLPAGSGVNTTMICTHVLNKGGKQVSSPLDELEPSPPRLECG